MIVKLPFSSVPFDDANLLPSGPDDAPLTPPPADGPPPTHEAFGLAAESGVASAEPFVLWGSRWGSDPTHLGGAGGVVTWSVVGDGTPIAPGISSQLGGDFGHPVTAATAPSSFLFDGFVDQLRAAFAEWSAVSNIDFVQVADGGDSVGAGTSGDIRISGISEDGPGGTLAVTYFPNQGPISGDVFIDTGDAGFYDPHSLFLVATHEIGHAIGLGHSQDHAAVMYPYYNGALTGLGGDDVAGAQAIYGPADPNAVVAYAVPAGQTALTIIDAPAHLVVNANDAGDAITAPDQGTIINGGAGSDTIVGGAGDDVLSGGGGADHFVFAAGGGNDTVTDFNPAEDVVEFRGTGEGFDPLAAMTSGDGGNTVITLDPATHIMLANVAVAQIPSSDFAFT